MLLFYLLPELNSSFSRRESIRGRKEFHRGHAKPLRGASKDSPQEATAHRDGEGGYPLTHSEGHGVLSFMRLKARKLCVHWVQRRGKATASQNSKRHYASFLKET